MKTTSYFVKMNFVLMELNIVAVMTMATSTIEGNMSIFFAALINFNINYRICA